MVTKIWDDYNRWNAAIADRYFNPGFSQIPVYLDLDDGMLAEISAANGFDLGDAASADFLDVVRSTFEIAEDFLWRHERLRKQWLVGEYPAGPDVPPFIALLGFFDYVAYTMKKEGQFNANNYHGRLAELVRK